jgi:uncharacterized cupredoxin-like copper-binding protein
MKGSRLHAINGTGPLLVSALLVLLAGSACGKPAGRTVEITVHHSRYEPATIEAAPGEVVRFVIRNLDPIDHEFILGPTSVQLRHETGTEPHHGTVPGEVSIPAGGERATTYTFSSIGAVPFGCHLPGHWAYGMRGSVLVG